MSQPPQLYPSGWASGVAGVPPRPTKRSSARTAIVVAVARVLGPAVVGGDDTQDAAATLVYR